MWRGLLPDHIINVFPSFGHLWELRQQFRHLLLKEVFGGVAIMEPATNSVNSIEDGDTTVTEGIREQLVSTAIKFLQNPRVHPTSMGQKRTFLRKKGLTENEIEVACQKAGLFGDLENNNIVAPGQIVPIGTYPDSRTSLWIKAKDVANLVALISIGSYSLYSLWKSYIAPRIFGTQTRQEQKYEQLLKSILQLNESVNELKQIIRDSQLQGAHSSKSYTRTFEIQEVKNELATIKSLLLGRSQFSSPPAIPSWQLVDGTVGDDSNENSDESTSRRRKNKPDRSRNEDLSAPETDDGEEGRSMRKHPSIDSNNGLMSGSSCEVVFLPKTDSDPDHSDE